MEREQINTGYSKIWVEFMAAAIAAFQTQDPLGYTESAADCSFMADAALAEYRARFEPEPKEDPA